MYNSLKKVKDTIKYPYNQKKSKNDEKLGRTKKIDSQTQCNVEVK